VLRYQRGLFLPEAGVSNLDKLAREARADELFMDMLRRFSNQNRNASEKPFSKNYAPTLFCKEDEAKKVRIKKPELEDALRRLFAADKITVENYGPACRGTTRLASK
jgi:hypothetical protein